MKKILLLLTCIFALSIVGVAQVKWHTVDEASKAKIGEKFYFIDFYTDWCGYCHKMDRTTFKDPTVAKILNRYFYPVKFNAEGDNAVTWQGRKYLPAQSDSRNKIHDFAMATLGPRMGFPSFVILNADGTMLQTVPGYYNANDFIVILWYFASGDCNKYRFDKYQKIFDKDIRHVMNQKLR